MISASDMQERVRQCDEMLARYRAGLHRESDDPNIYPTREETIAMLAKLYGADLAQRLVDRPKR